MSKGDYFEAKVFDTLNNFQGFGLNKVLANLFVPKENGKTTQVDLVLINKTGIYVIEVKNYNSIVRGNNTIKEWKKFNENQSTATFHNPIKQNNAHVYGVKRILDKFDDSYFTSLIIFSNSTTINYKSNSKLPFYTEVINYKDTLLTLIEIFSSKEDVFSDDDIYEIYNKLSKYVRSSKKQKFKNKK